MEVIFGLFLLLVILFITFVPSIIAIKKKKHNATLIIVLNMFFAWTIIGWFVALYFAIKTDPQDQYLRRIS